MKAIDFCLVHKGRPVNDMLRDELFPVRTNPTLDECRYTGMAHKSYGWNPSTYSHWSHDQVNAYCEAYDAWEKV